MSKPVLSSMVAALAGTMLLGGPMPADAAPASAGAPRIAVAHSHHRHLARTAMSGPMARRMMTMVGPMLAGAMANGGMSGLGQGAFGQSGLGGDIATYAPVMNAVIGSGAMSGVMSGMGGSGMNLGALAGMAGGMGAGAAPY